MATAVAQVSSGVASWIWACPGQRGGNMPLYRGPLRAHRQRGYHVRLTREGIALWPTYAPPEELEDPHAHPLRVAPP